MVSFDNGQALIVGIANYHQVPALPETVLNDAKDISGLLANVALCGYPPHRVQHLFDDLIGDASNY